MNEEWIETNNKSDRGDTIIAISNRGRIWRKNGTIEESTYKQKVYIDGKCTYIYRFIVKHFIPQTDEDKALGRDCIDHITHYPKDMNINDTRNLRWCTKKENNNFDEGRENKRKAMLNKPRSEFGKKYIEHYGYGMSENPKQYIIEHNWYIRHNHKCRWE